MAILVTGGTGFIGSHTAVELLNAGYELVIVDNFRNSKKEVLNRLRTITGREVRFYEVDLLNVSDLEKVFQENQLEAVIHFAGLKAVGESVAMPLTYYHNNITGTLNLCALMQKYDVKKIVFSSSATVYGMNHESPLTEDLSLSTTNPYGSTKMMIEMILRDLYISDPSFGIVLLRYFNPIGAHESGLIGEDPSGIPNNLMPFITQVAVGKREMLSVFGSDYPTHDGTGVRDYIHVVDLANGHLCALKYILEHKGVEAINLGTGIGYSVLDIVRSFEEANGIKIPYRLVDRRPGDIAECYADVKKADQLLHFKTKKNIVDMCRDSWNWQKNNPSGYDEA